MRFSADAPARTTAIDQISAIQFRSEAEFNSITGLIVDTDDGVRYIFEIDKSFLGPNIPAFVLRNVFPSDNSDIEYALKESKFWVYGGELTKGGVFTLKQGAFRQRDLLGRFTIVRIFALHE